MFKQCLFKFTSSFRYKIFNLTITNKQYPVKQEDDDEEFQDFIYKKQNKNFKNLSDFMSV